VKKSCASARHCAFCRSGKNGIAFRARLGLATCPRSYEIDATVAAPVAESQDIQSDAFALAGYIAQQAEILARTDLTPCRRAHHEKKLASYREMLQHAKG
jgi:hypothetical protein